MTTFRIGAAPIKQQLISDPEYAAKAVLELDETAEPSNTTMSDALSSNSLYSERSIIMFHSTRLASRVGFILSAQVSMIATRIQKLANPPKSSTTDPATIKAEIKECLGKLIWGYSNIGDHMRSVDNVINEWCGGGYSRPRTNEEIQQVADALGISVEAARASAETNRTHTRDFLTIRRQNLGPIMISKIYQLIQDFTGLEIEPDEDMLKTSMEATFQNAILWGDWAEAKLVKEDASDWLGISLELPTASAASAEKANRIREQLAEKQAQAAQNEAQALVSFNLDDLAA